MKKLSFVLIVLSLLCVVSCKGDIGKGGNIIGRWVHGNEETNNYHEWGFLNDGKCDFRIYTGYFIPSTSKYGNYVISGSLLTVTFDDETVCRGIYSVEGNKLIFHSGDFDYDQYTRSDD